MDFLYNFKFLITGLNELEETNLPKETTLYASVHPICSSVK